LFTVRLKLPRRMVLQNVMLLSAPTPQMASLLRSYVSIAAFMEKGKANLVRVSNGETRKYDAGKGGKPLWHACLLSIVI
jgi:hypothetical protein